MAPPTKQIEPKSRAQLWRETIAGFLILLCGLGVVAWYVYHATHGHTGDRAVVGFGVGLTCFGAFLTNKKLVREFFGEVKDFVRVWKWGGDS